MGDYLTATNGSIPGVTASSKGHIDLQVPDTGHFSGTSHTTVNRTSHGKPLTMSIDKTFLAKFLGAACGDVKPVVVPGKRSG